MILHLIQVIEQGKFYENVACNYLEWKRWKTKMASRAKMSQADRAKQFMPFSALKGFEEALREKEKLVVEKICLSEERKQKI